MKLWVDDLRPPPDGTWQWVKNAHDAMHALRHYQVTEMSLDHDLGHGGPTLGVYDTKPIIYWLIQGAEEGCSRWPAKVSVHSQNPVGAEWLVGMIERYKP